MTENDPDALDGRHLPFDSASNFRDLGGYEADAGRRIRWNRLYRSATLAELSDQDQSNLAELGLAVICDLRRDEEREDAPSRLHAAKIPEVLSFNIGPSRKGSQIYAHLSSETTTQDDMRSRMRELYRSFVSDFQAEYSRLLRYMLDHERLPLLFHCTAGKDRTGFAAAITLGALGVPREIIFEDYLLTNELLRFSPKEGSLMALSPELFHVMIAADPSYLEAAFAQIDEEYGGFDRYLAEALGFGEPERDLLRAHLLE